MKREWVIKRVVDDFYYEGKHKHGDEPIKDMFATFTSIDKNRIKTYPNQANAVIALQEIKEPGRYIIESHFIIEQE